MNEKTNSDLKSERVQSIINRHVLMASGVGVIPIPIVDMIGIIGVQTKMIKSLTCEYKIPFMKNALKGIIGSFLGTVGAIGIVGMVTGTLFKTVPVFGTVMGMACLPILSGSFTYALGRVLAAHFDSGGNLLDFDNKKFINQFKQEFNNGKKIVSNLLEKKNKKK